MAITERTSPGRVSAEEIKRYPWKFECEKDWCYTTVVTRSREEAEHVKDTHPCRRSGVTTLSWSAIMPAVRDLWEELDGYYDQLVTMEPGTNDHARQVGMMRGIAISLSHIMKPYFETPDDIVRETIERHKARANGDESYRTPGIENVTLFPEEATKWYRSWDGGYTSNPAFASEPPVGYPLDRINEARSAAGMAALADPPSRPAMHVTTGGSDPRTMANDELRGAQVEIESNRVKRGLKGAAKPAPAPRKAKVKVFSDHDKEQIRAAHAAGFDMNMLTTAYSCSVADIKAVLDG